MDAQQREKWLAEASDIESPLQASTTLKNALPRAASAIVHLLEDSDASPRLRFDAAKFVIEHSLGTGVDMAGNPWDKFLDDVKDDVN